MQPAIRIEGISKQYRLGAGGGGAYRTLRESVTDSAVATWQRLTRLARSKAAAASVNQDLTNGHSSNGDAGPANQDRPNTFWALNDVSFDVKHGEVVGIIGRNGAGKSTLLKILSRITEPTRGRITLNGRVASLLEVGTGFHPELTGRENIFLNGAILGMTRREIGRNFDQIVDFSGIEKFLDTPVKRYSSGMYVRLAFAVAAHLEPEILLIDEVIAVGDFEFQKKCLGKMRDVAKGGRTVLFVSHNMAAMEALCDRGVELHRGVVMSQGDIQVVINDYRRRLLNSETGCLVQFPDPQHLHSVSLFDSSGEPTTVIPIGQDVEIHITFGPNADVLSPRLYVQVDDLFGTRVLTVQTPANADVIGSLTSAAKVVCRIHEFPLAPGQYSLSIQLMENRQVIEHRRECIRFSVVNAELFNEGRGFAQGLCVARSSWNRPAEIVTT